MSRARARVERLERVAAPAPPAEPTLADDLDADPRLRYAYAIFGMPLEIVQAAHQVDRDRRASEIVAHAEQVEPLLGDYMRRARQAVDAYDQAGDAGAELVLPHDQAAFDRARWRLYMNPDNIVPYEHGSTNRYTLPLRYDLSTAPGAAEAVLDHWAHATATLHKRGCDIQGSADQVRAALAWYPHRDEPPF